MSKVYEALQKAEREGKLRRNRADHGDAPEQTQVEGDASTPGVQSGGEASVAGASKAPETGATQETGRTAAAPAAEAVSEGSAIEAGDAGQAAPIVERGEWPREEDTGAPTGERRAPVEAESYKQYGRGLDEGTGGGSSVPREETDQPAILAPISDDFREREKIPPLVRSGREAAEAAEQFQVLRSFVQDWVAEHSKRIFIVTSALRQEGKSFAAINLATSLATPETPVVLVDADCRAPSVHRVFNLTPMTGLTTYLQGDATLEECLHDTHIEGLRVLPAGKSGLGNPEAFAGKRMRRLVEELRALRPEPIVLFDAPATLAAPETKILSRHMEVGILVVAANMTPRKLVAQTLDLLKPLPFCGVVLNRFVPPYSVARKVSYGYGYPVADGNGNGNSSHRRRFSLSRALFRS